MFATRTTSFWHNSCISQNMEKLPISSFLMARDAPCAPSFAFLGGRSKVMLRDTMPGGSLAYYFADGDVPHSGVSQCHLSNSVIPDLIRNPAFSFLDSPVPESRSGTGKPGHDDFSLLSTRDGDTALDVRPTSIFSPNPAELISKMSALRDQSAPNTDFSSAILRKQNEIAFSKGSWYLAFP